ncbi:MAG: ATP-binding protein [Pirellulales bacterium]
MAETSEPWSVRLEIPSERGAGQAFLGQMLDHLHAQHWPDAEVFGIHLAVEEAVVNAAHHGNCFAEDKRVRILCEVKPERFWIEIEDEGCGFDPYAVPDCTAEDRLEVPSGRGVMLMRAFMNTIEYNTCGNRVRMEKLRGVPVDVEDED